MTDDKSRRREKVFRKLWFKELDKINKTRNPFKIVIYFCRLFRIMNKETDLKMKRWDKGR